MASYSRKSTRNKALWGYLLLIAVLLSSSWFVYHEINLLVSIKAVEADMRLKRQEMSSALSALYRAERWDNRSFGDSFRIIRYIGE